MRSLISLLPLFALTLPVTAGVIVVDSSGGGHAQIQQGIYAAVDGDTVLVRSGLYQAFVVDDESISIVADTGASVVVTGGIEIKNLGAGKAVVLSGLTSIGDQAVPWYVPNGLRVTDSLGSVRVEDCALFGSPGDNSVPLSELPGTPALFASAARDLSLHDCTLVGGPGASAWLGGDEAAGGHGAEVAGSVVSFHDCLVRGNKGAEGDDIGDGAPGGHGLYAHVEASAPWLTTRVHAAGSHFDGADGTTDWLCFVAGQGGDGVRLEGVGTIAILLDNTYEAGTKGSCGSWGYDGKDLVAHFGAGFHSLPGTARDLTATTPVRELETLALVAEGEPGDTHLVLLSSVSMQLGSTTFSGTQLIGLPLTAPGLLATMVQLGPGPTSAQVPIPNLPPGVDGLTLFSQLVTLDATGAIWFASPETLVLLDQAF